MLFQTMDFAVFLPVVFAIYWALAERLRWQNAWVVLASQVFFGWWDWRFLGLLWFSAGLDFLCARRIDASESPRRRRLWLNLSLTGNLGLLAYFKYTGFFLESFSTAFSWFGVAWDDPALRIVLPVGISFYTFQTMSYTIDVYRRELRAERDPVAYLAYVSFFPQLVAGPIERARSLLTQFHVPRRFDGLEAADGLRQILWGLCKKVLVADACGRYAYAVFADPGAHGAGSALVAALLTVVQIYGDFSGYSDIAVGTARLFGIRLVRNFRFPLFATTVPDFWRRWHISLMGWFRDYVYRPLGGSRHGRARHLRNLAAIFLLSAFWHGPKWTFIWWGVYSFLTFLPQERKVAPAPSLRSLPHISLTLLIISLGAVLFRAGNLPNAAAVYGRLVDWQTPFAPLPWATVIPLAVMVGLEWWARDDAHALENLLRPGPRWARWGLYYGLIVAFVAMGEGAKRTYVYFRF